MKPARIYSISLHLREREKLPLAKSKGEKQGVNFLKKCIRPATGIKAAQFQLAFSPSQ
jgi:hypothetical protein